MKKNLATLFLFLFFTLTAFCEEFTLGTIQQRLQAGMSQAEVASCIGAPNIVTKNAEGCETWIYEKTSQSNDSNYKKRWFWFLFFGKGDGCKHSESSQKTITVVVNFDKNSCLQTFTYNASSF